MKKTIIIPFSFKYNLLNLKTIEVLIYLFLRLKKTMIELPSPNSDILKSNQQNLDLK